MTARYRIQLPLSLLLTLNRRLIIRHVNNSLTQGLILVQHL